MVHEPAPQRRERARVDREPSPSISLSVDARLRPWVAGGYGGFDQASLPHGDYVVPATLTTPLTVYAVDVSSLPSRPPARVNGPSTTYTRTESPYAPAVMASLAPLGAYKLLGPALAEIGGTIVGLEDIAGAEARRLSEQIQTAPTWDERGRLLDTFLLNRTTHGPQPSPEVRHAWHLLTHSGGRDPIKKIARQVGWSHKHLITKFKQQVGVTPHIAARLLRLSTVWEHIDHEQTWAHIAAESGYADQSHLIREFRHFTGTTPAALIT